MCDESHTYLYLRGTNPFSIIQVASIFLTGYSLPFKLEQVFSNP